MHCRASIAPFVEDHNPTCNRSTGGPLTNSQLRPEQVPHNLFPAWIDSKKGEIWQWPFVGYAVCDSRWKQFNPIPAEVWLINANDASLGLLVVFTYFIAKVWPSDRWVCRGEALRRGSLCCATLACCNPKTCAQPGCATVSCSTCGSAGERWLTSSPWSFAMRRCGERRYSPRQMWNCDH